MDPFQQYYYATSHKTNDSGGGDQAATNYYAGLYATGDQSVACATAAQLLYTTYAEATAAVVAQQQAHASFVGNNYTNDLHLVLPQRQEQQAFACNQDTLPENMDIDGWDGIDTYLQTLDADGPHSSPSNWVLEPAQVEVDATLPFGWEEHLDASLQRHYYVNYLTGASQWERPSS